MSSLQNNAQIVDREMQPAQPAQQQVQPPGWLQTFDSSKIKTIDSQKSNIDRFDQPDAMSSISMIQQFVNARDKGIKSSVDKGKAIEYLKPIIPKKYIIGKKQTYSEESAFSFNFASASLTAGCKFYYTTKAVQQASHSWIGSTQSSAFAVPGKVQINPQTKEPLSDWKEIKYVDISSMFSAGTYNINQALEDFCRTNNIVAIGILLSNVTILNSSDKKDYTGDKEKAFQDSVVDEDAVQQMLDYQALNLFTGYVKFVHMMRFCVGGPFANKLSELWSNSKVCVGLVPRDAFRYGNTAYSSAHVWYSTRAMTKLNEVSKLIMKPVTLDLGRTFDKFVLKRSEIPVPTALAVRYQPAARRAFQSNLKVVGAPADSYLHNVMQDRVVVLEPECRSLDRYKLMDSWAVAKQRWSQNRKTTSGKYELESFVSQQLYEKIASELKTEVDLLKQNSLERYYLEWPTAKLGNFSFIKDVAVSFVMPDWMQVIGADQVNLLKQPNMVLNGNQTIDGKSSHSILNYSLVSKFVWERRVMAPILERIQFTRNLKSTYYIKQVLQSRTVKEPGSLIVKDVGVILKKKKRAQLKAVVQQSTLSYDAITMPFVQAALHWFKVYDATSMNIRRLVCFSLYHALNNQATSYSDFRVNPWLQPLRQTREPRYVVAAGRSSLVDLDQWHDAYKYLAESGVRSGVRKKLQKIFKYMKRMQKVQNVFSQKEMVSKAVEGDALASRRLEFAHHNDSTLAFFGVFYLCCELGRTPTYLDSRTAAKGFHVHNAAATDGFAKSVNSLQLGYLYGEGGPYAPNYQTVNTKLMDTFLGRMKDRVYTIGVESDGYTPIKLQPSGGDKTKYDDLLKFCVAYYPGVSTLLHNAVQVDGRDISLQALMDSLGFESSHQLDFYCNMAMFFELFETGIILVQTFNTAYFKDISDFSFGLLCSTWFILIQDLAKSITVSHVHAPSQEAFQKVYGQPLKAIAAMAEYIYRDIVREPRPDRVSSKTKKTKSEYMLFYGLLNITGDYYSENQLKTSSTYTRDRRDARRGTMLNLDSIKDVGERDVYATLAQVKDAAMIQSKSVGVLGKRTRGGRQRTTQIPLTDQEKARQKLYSQPGGLLNVQQQAADGQQNDGDDEMND